MNTKPKHVASGRLTGPLEWQNSSLLEGPLPDAIAAAYEERGTNKIADYAFGLAQTFSSYYNQFHILSEQDKALLQSRLALCAVTLRTLELSLSLLGIEVPERM